ncbi:MAG: hypothetical protein QXZ20_03975, partial [Candidatus Aenigmatarchaeota archaeon]
MLKNILIFVLLLFFAVFFIFSSTTLAAQDTVTIDVNISTTAQIILLPESLNWTNVSTGSTGGHKNITLKNAGSVNVSQIYAYVDTLEDESTRPYGSDDPQSYAAGGVLTIKNETDDAYYFIGRLEWNWTQDIPNHVWNVNSPVAWGYFRNTTNDYVWVLGNGTDGMCNASGAQFKIESDIDLGTQETRTPNVDGGTVETAGDWGLFTISSSPLAGYCVAAYYDCSKIYIYNYDKRTDLGDCDNADYLHEGQLSPG